MITLFIQSIAVSWQLRACIRHSVPRTKQNLPFTHIFPRRHNFPGRNTANDTNSANVFINTIQ